MIFTIKITENNSLFFEDLFIMDSKQSVIETFNFIDEQKENNSDAIYKLLIENESDILKEYRTDNINELEEIKRKIYHLLIKVHSE